MRGWSGVGGPRVETKDLARGDRIDDRIVDAAALIVHGQIEVGS